MNRFYNGIRIGLFTLELTSLALQLFPSFRFALTSPLTAFGALTLAFFIHERKTYYTVRSGENPVIVHDAVIQHYVEDYWKKRFPQHPIPQTSILSNSTISIKASFPYVPKDRQQLFLKMSEKDLSNIFKEMLGYQATFFLSASFKH